MVFSVSFSISFVHYTKEREGSGYEEETKESSGVSVGRWIRDYFRRSDYSPDLFYASGVYNVSTTALSYGTLFCNNLYGKFIVLLPVGLVKCTAAKAQAIFLP